MVSTEIKGVCQASGQRWSVGHLASAELLLTHFRLVAPLAVVVIEIQLVIDTKN